jgi:cellulose synthase/poly-beta-1,6-N-acetylglucosamine synthase-like glycosyltransferase
VKVAEKPTEAAVPFRGYGMVSFVVPAHNEEGTISQRITRAYERAASHVGSSEIIVVDDGSLDNTYEVAWSAVELNRRKWPNIPAKVVKLSAYLGREEAVRIGRNKATGERVETVNGNGSGNGSSLSVSGLISHVFLPV